MVDLSKSEHSIFTTAFLVLRFVYIGGDVKFQGETGGRSGDGCLIMESMMKTLQIFLLTCLIFFQINLLYSEDNMSFSLTSPAFTHGGEIPSRYTCQGKDQSPALEWAGVPAGTKSLVLIVDDPDAPDPKAPRMIWVHWVLFDIPFDAAGLPEGVSSRNLPEGTREGMNDWNKTGWGGPCPPVGTHRYFFKLYALDRVLDLPGHPGKKKVESAMKGHVLDEAVLMGTYRKR